MDCIPEDAIDAIELEILQKVLEHYPTQRGYTIYTILPTSTHLSTRQMKDCDIAQEGKKQTKAKRSKASWTRSGCYPRGFHTVNSSFLQREYQRQQSIWKAYRLYQEKDDQTEY